MSDNDRSESIQDSNGWTQTSCDMLINRGRHRRSFYSKRRVFRTISLIIIALSSCASAISFTADQINRGSDIEIPKLCYCDVDNNGSLTTQTYSLMYDSNQFGERKITSSKLNWVGGGISALIAIASGIITFCNLSTSMEQSRVAANSLTSLSRDTLQIIASNPEDRPPMDKLMKSTNRKLGKIQEGSGDVAQENIVLDHIQSKVKSAQKKSKDINLEPNVDYFHKLLFSVASNPNIQIRKNNSSHDVNLEGTDK